MMNGVLHVHSVFSDGEESLERLAEIFRRSGMDFMAVSDHAEVFDDERMDRYVQACAALSTKEFEVVPGLEFASHAGLHILGYGVTRRFRAKDPEAIVDGIHEAGGIAVLAHPPTGCINLITSIKHKLDGIEVWNGRYDGVFSPRAESFQLLRRIRMLNAKTSAYGGIDLHKMEQARKPIRVELDLNRSRSDETEKRQAILNALRSGEFRVRGGNFGIPASGHLTFVQELSIAVKQPLCRRRAG